MSQRLRGYDVRVSDFPNALGLCQSDNVGVFNGLNSCQRRLLYCKEAGEESWHGTWAETIFTLTQAAPYVTFDSSVARLELADMCDRPISVRNQFYEYLRFGNGRLPKLFAQQHVSCLRSEAFSRNFSPTFVDITTPPQFIQVLISNNQDVGKRALLQGLDQNNNIIYSQDGFNRVTGIYGVFTTPFFQWPLTFNSITGIQKDITAGPVSFFSVDPNTGAQVLLVTMQPNETTAWYRRYFFNPLPFNCCSGIAPSACQSTTGTVPTNITVTGIVKLEFQPVTTDADYCLIQNLEALIEEAHSYRYSKMDSLQSKQLEAIKHRNAVRLLNGEIGHYYGIEEPSIRLDVFGDAHLWRLRIGSML